MWSTRRQERQKSHRKEYCLQRHIDNGINNGIEDGTKKGIDTSNEQTRSMEKGRVGWKIEKETECSAWVDDLQGGTGAG